jgi:hypothetical protein
MMSLLPFAILWEYTPFCNGPDEAIDRITQLVFSRSSLIISDEGLSSETSRGTEFVIVMSDEPQGGLAHRRRGSDNGVRYGSRRARYWRSPFGNSARVRDVEASIDATRGRLSLVASLAWMFDRSAAPGHLSRVVWLIWRLPYSCQAHDYPPKIRGCKSLWTIRSESHAGLFSPTVHSGTTDQCDRSMYIDSHSLALLLAIAVLSYLLGYLCSQMQFGDTPADGTSSRKQTPKD